MKVSAMAAALSSSPLQFPKLARFGRAGPCRRLPLKSRTASAPAYDPSKPTIRLEFLRTEICSPFVGSSRSRLHGAGHGTVALGETRSRFTKRLCSGNAEASSFLRDAPESVQNHSQTADGQTPDWKIKMLFDGDCPLCMREVDMLRERNKEYGTIKFVDISDPSYDARDNSGIDFETAMGRIHAIGWDGTVWTNIQAFKKLYEYVGLGWVYSFTQYPVLAKFADGIYDAWAKYRLPITGRPGLEVVLENRRKQKETGECDLDGRCKTE